MRILGEGVLEGVFENGLLGGIKVLKVGKDLNLRTLGLGGAGGRGGRGGCGEIRKADVADARWRQ